MSSFVQTYIKEIISVGGLFVAWFLNTRMQPKARLHCGTRHDGNILLNEPTFDQAGNLLYTTKLVEMRSTSFVNSGRNPATNVEITYNWKPQHCNVWPARNYTTAVTDSGRFTFKLGTLAPKEHVVVDILGVLIGSGGTTLPMMNSAKCDQCVARSVELAPQIVFKPWLRACPVGADRSGLCRQHLRRASAHPVAGRPCSVDSVGNGLTRVAEYEAARRQRLAGADTGLSLTPRLIGA